MAEGINKITDIDECLKVEFYIPSKYDSAHISVSGRTDRQNKRGTEYETRDKK
jgi:hypothetical protein